MILVLEKKKKETKTPRDLIKIIRWILVNYALFTQSQNYPWTQAMGQNRTSNISEVC